MQPVLHSQIFNLFIKFLSGEILKDDWDIEIEGTIEGMEWIYIHYRKNMLEKDANRIKTITIAGSSSGLPNAIGKR